jgi:hypothetical protein
VASFKLDFLSQVKTKLNKLLSFQSLNRGSSKKGPKEAKVKKQPESIPIFIYLQIENITIFS